ncbi:hypothetical protein HYZ80_01290 [Candidatus Parcubacteria bacterium]|nr:hypothetical protein [Candidatus Parcubacteria bacterium]
MVESESGSGSQQPTPPSSSASGGTVTPAGQKKVQLFNSDKWVESGRLMPWVVLAAVIATFTWIVSDAWSRTWQEVEVDQAPLVRLSRQANAIPSGWKIYRVVVDGETMPLPFTFAYPPILGEVRSKSGIGLPLPASQSYAASLEILGVPDQPEIPFIPTVYLTRDAIIAPYLGPIHGAHEAFIDDDGDYGGQKKEQRVYESVLAHLAGVTAQNFCEELGSGPLNHGGHLVLPDHLKRRVIELEQTNDFRGLYGFSQRVVSCEVEGNIASFIVAIQMPARWTPNADIVEVRSVGAVKFMDGTSEFSSFAVVSLVRFGEEYAAQYSEGEVLRIIRLMVRSFRFTDDGVR